MLMFSYLQLISIENTLKESTWKSFDPINKVNVMEGTTRKRPVATVARSAKEVLKIVSNDDGKGLL